MLLSYPILLVIPIPCTFVCVCVRERESVCVCVYYRSRPEVYEEQPFGRDVEVLRFDISVRDPRDKICFLSKISALVHLLYALKGQYMRGLTEFFYLGDFS